MKNKRLTTGFIIITLLTFKAYGQESGQTSWREELKSCQVDIPLYYATKNQPKLLEAADTYKGVELILVTVDKKKGTSCKSYYLERYESGYGPSAYLVKSEYFSQERRPEHVIFLSYNPKKHIFYEANCFRENPMSKELKTEE